jgi:hypothetical protein
VWRPHHMTPTNTWKLKYQHQRLCISRNYVQQWRVQKNVPQWRRVTT